MVCIIRREFMPTAREKQIKVLVAKFIKLVESLNPGERLSIRKVAAKKAGAKKAAKTQSSVRSKTKKAKS
jgi:hypothetical protein